MGQSANTTQASSQYSCLIMFQAYIRAFQTPGSLRFSSAGLVGRLPASMTGLGIVLLVEHTTDSYAFAGVVAAVYILTSAIAAPIQGRLADRIGQRPVLLTASSLYAAGVAALLAAVGDYLFLTLLAAVLAGAGAPQTGNMVRTRWTHAASDRQVLSTAFALEAIFDEVVFIVGPVLVTFLTLNVSPPLGLSVAAGAALVGAWGLAFQQGTAPVIERINHKDKPPLDLVSLGALIVAAIGVGVVFGSSEILIVAFTDEQGQKSLAGWVLAISSFGSLLAGFLVGARQSVSQPISRLRLFTLLLVASLLPLPLAHTTWQLTIGMFIMGLTIAPTLIAAVNLVEHVTALSRLTEALTWVTTGLSGGVALGAVISGRVVENVSASAGFLIPAAAAATTALVAWLAPVPQVDETSKNT